MMRSTALCMALCFPLAAHAGNIKDTDLVSSNTFFLPPAPVSTIFVQARNASDNQDVTLNDLGARLSAKGYQVIQDPEAATYVVLANIVYCNITKPDMPVEALVAGGYGSGFGSSLMGGLQSVAGMASMAGPQGAIGGAAVSMGLNAISGIGSAVGSLFSGPSKPRMPDDVNYACVADLQIMDRAAAAANLTSGKSEDGVQPGIYQMRLAATVSQKKLNEAEATPLLQQKLSAAVAGNF
jgi:hypothetical protein